VNKTAKILLTGFSVFLFVLVLVICALPGLINPNDYKPELSVLIKRTVGYDAAFKGDMTLSIFPEIVLNIEKMEISNQRDVQKIPLMTIENSAIKLNALSLLRNKIDIYSIALHGLTLNLVKNKQGLNNWDDLIASNVSLQSNKATTKQSADKFTKLSTLAALSVSGIAIQNARINWIDQQTGEHLAFKHISFDTDKLVLGEWLNMNLSMDISGNFAAFPLPVNGALKWVTDLRVDEKFDQFIFRNSRIEGIMSQTTAQPLTTTVTIPNATASIGRQTLQLSGLEFRSGDITINAELTGEQLIDKLFIQGSATIAPFNPRVLFKRWGFTLPVMRDSSSLTNLGMSFHFKANPKQVEFNHLDAVLDNSHGTGSVTVKNFARPTLLCDLAVDSIDVDRYFASKGNASLMAANTYVEPLNWLKKLDAEGNITVGKMTFNGMVVQNARLSLGSKQLSSK
jgi:AsmA protein